MDNETVVSLLREEVKRLGGEAQFAREAGVTVQLVNAVLRGVRNPRGKILSALGLEWHCEIRRAEKGPDNTRRTEIVGQRRRKKGAP